MGLTVRKWVRNRVAVAVMRPRDHTGMALGMRAQTEGLKVSCVEWELRRW